MKAIYYTKYGAPDVLELKEVEKPIPKDHEVLVKVHAASVNSWDWDMLRGKPFIVRLWGLLEPKYKIPGADIAGRVVAVGKDVKGFQPGDEVFGDLCESSWGGFAEFVCAAEKALQLKPASMSFEQAAAIPQAAVLALQGLREKGRIQPGQRVLINGAGGGVGSFAIQLAKFFGAEVTGVDSTEKLEVMRSLGADFVIDYTQVDFTRNGLCYDLILDVTATHSMFDYKRALSDVGRYVMVGGAMSRMFQLLVLAPWISKRGKKSLGFLGVIPNKGLDFICDLFEAGKLVPLIDRRFALNDVPEAFRYFGAGGVLGKVIVYMEDVR